LEASAPGPEITIDLQATVAKASIERSRFVFGKEISRDSSKSFPEGPGANPAGSLQRRLRRGSDRRLLDDRLLSADLICGAPGAAENKVHWENHDADATRQRPTQRGLLPGSNLEFVAQRCGICSGMHHPQTRLNRVSPPGGMVNYGSVSDSRPHEPVGSVFGTPDR
jgi:hypothetical protein